MGCAETEETSFLHEYKCVASQEICYGFAWCTFHVAPHMAIPCVVVPSVVIPHVPFYMLHSMPLNYISSYYAHLAGSYV